MIALILNWLLDHTNKRWVEEQDRIIHDAVYYDQVIGQLP